ncbi:MAG: DciA family protein [Rhodomicrobium sp.]
MPISSSRGNSPGSPSAFSGPAAIGRFVAPIAGEALSRGGTVLCGLLSQWLAIAGPSLASYTLPTRLTRAAPEPGTNQRNAPSTLLLKVDPSKALEVQYSVPQLIERINQALGYKAVAELRLIQAPVKASAPRATPSVIRTRKHSTGPECSRLAAALERMAAGVEAREATR